MYVAYIMQPIHEYFTVGLKSIYLHALHTYERDMKGKPAIKTGKGGRNDYSSPEVNETK